MKLTAGTKIRSAVCSLEAIVIRPPSEEADLSCGGVAMVAPGSEGTGAMQLADAEPGQALIGKRYVDLTSGLEVLCTKGGKGALSFGERALTPKEAKPLPSSD